MQIRGEMPAHAHGPRPQSSNLQVRSHGPETMVPTCPKKPSATDYHFPSSRPFFLFLSGNTYLVALGLVHVLVAKDAGWEIQWGGLGLSEAAGGLLDEAQGSGQDQGTNF